MSLDYLAYIILTVFYILTAVPIIGGQFTQSGVTYKEDMTAGLCLHGFVLIVCGCIFAVMWSFNQLNWL